jgi:hypothetical protein
MSLWREDLTSSSLEEVLEWQAENRAWSKDLRRRTSVLVNSRLANDMSQVDYVASRKLTHEETAECRRRANMLETQLSRRTFGPLLRER